MYKTIYLISHTSAVHQLKRGANQEEQYYKDNWTNYFY
jgi:hypothetical protein